MRDMAQLRLQVGGAASFALVLGPVPRGEEALQLHPFMC